MESGQQTAVEAHEHGLKSALDTTKPENNKKPSRHNFYLQLKSTPGLQVFSSVGEVRKAVKDLDKSEVVRVIKGFEKPLRAETRLSL